MLFLGSFSGRRVLVTGNTGFKGSWLSFWLRRLGAEVWGYSLPAPTDPNLHEVLREGTFAGEVRGDVRDRVALEEAVRQIRPDLVFHLAAQPIVRRSYAEPLETFETNALGTAHLLEGVRRVALPCPVVLITSDKCYENREWEFAYRENDPLGGHDVYSMSKAAAELVAASWRRSFFTPSSGLGPVATARAGNVIGGGDYAPDRIVPDCVRALQASQPILVRNPAAIRPWQHVLESLSGYLWLAARLMRAPREAALASAFNFGPDPAARQPVGRLVAEVLRHWPGQWIDGSDPQSPHEARLLTLSIDRAAGVLGWRPVWSFEECVQHTVAWYHRRHAQRAEDLAAFSASQIEAYTEAARRQHLPWATV